MPLEEIRTFESELRRLIGQYFQDHISNTPDFILSQYILGCLLSFNVAVQQRDLRQLVGKYIVK